MALGRMHQNFESLVIEGISLHQIEDIEFVFYVLPGVGDGEEVPLRVSTSVVIWMDDEIVLIWGTMDGQTPNFKKIGIWARKGLFLHLDGFFEISRLKSTFEN